MSDSHKFSKTEFSETDTDTIKEWESLKTETPHSAVQLKRTYIGRDTRGVGRGSLDRD